MDPDLPAGTRADHDGTCDSGTCHCGGRHDVADDDRADHDMVAVRAWARSRGYPIDESAGVPLVVLRTYRLLHAG